MRQTKQMLAFLMTVLLALPLICTTALASESTTDGHKLVVKNDASGYEYVLYQMLTGDISTKTENNKQVKVLSNAQWGTSVPEATQIAMYAYSGQITPEQRASYGTMSAEEKVQLLKNCSAQKVADYLAAEGESTFHSILNYMGSNDGSSLHPYTESGLTNGVMTGPANYTIGSETINGYGATNLPDGYYFIRNPTIPDSPDASYSDYIVTVVDSDVVVDPKAATTRSEKKVTDKNDSDPTNAQAVLNGVNQDSADHEIGDTIKYQLKVTLPNNFESYKDTGYKLGFTDNMSKGLTFNGDAKITYGTSGVTEDILLTRESITEAGDYQEGNKLTYSIANLYDIDALWNKDDGGTRTTFKLKANDVITIDYTATLNANAVVGTKGNPNEFFVEYSNNPVDFSKTNTTPADKNTVFTYRLTFNKVDKDKKPLSGATFTLKKLVKSDDGQSENWVDVTALHTGDDALNPRYSTEAKDSVAGSVHHFYGIDDGKYRLEETVTPTGYNTIAPIEFTVSATHDVTSDNPRLTEITATDGKEFTMTATKVGNDPDGTLSADIVNQAGATLPTTGGVGTTMLYVGGTVLVVGSAVALIIKRRLQNE